ncbi:cytochrome P450 family protein [Nocardiopsis dassonvillei]|uniref:cytochrome P450 family protein n=1 Tax=Nocardiopsis dassonvillei TaxID=2014 RepID=UPI003629D6D1
MHEDRGLGRRMQLVQGLHWLYGANGDPYAQLLRGFDDDVRPIHSALRERGALWTAKTGTRVSARHADASEVLSHTGFGLRRVAEQPAVQRVLPWDEDIVDIDAASIGRLQDPAEAGAMLETVSRAYQKALNGLGPDTDLVAKVAEPVPVEVLAELYGLTSGERARLSAACADTAIALDGLLCPQKLEPARRMINALGDLRTLFSDRPEGLVHAVVGVRISADLLSSAVAALLADPEQWTALVADPDRAAAVVTETLRHNPPVQVCTGIAQRDLRVSEVDVPAGSQVAVVLGAANRDPEVFADPDRFSPDRSGPRQGGDPAGLVLTPTAPAAWVLPLARRHAEAGLRALAAAFPRLSVAGPALRRPRAPMTRGLLRLPVHTG